MANCLMLLTRMGRTQTEPPPPRRVFECKICNWQFPSFQALGGHRTSHKKTRLTAGDLFHWVDSPPKPKTHECSICGVEFAIGQAQGGNMRRHHSATGTTTNVSMKAEPILKRSSSSKRVLCFDLNLTPYENHLKLEQRGPIQC